MRQQKAKTKNIHGERGIALVFAIIISLFLTVLGLGLTMFSITEYSAGREYESHQRAFSIADGGYGIMKGNLQGQDLTALLANSTAVPQYVNSEAVSSGTPPYRNPVYSIDARNIDYRDPPSPIGSINIPGLMTPASGTPLGAGYFFARVSDNADGDGDDTIDSDYTVFLRVIGVHQAPLAEITSHGGFVKNSVSIIESMVKRDTSFNLGSPLSIGGPDVDIRMSGTAFDVVGDDEHAGVAVFYDDPSGGDAAQTADSVYDALKKNQKKNIVGAEGDYGGYPEPSIRDDTDAIRNSPDPDAKNVLDPNFLYNFTTSVAGVANYSYSGNTHLSGGNVELGTESNPAITFVDGDLKLSGRGSGNGILVVTGEMDYSGAFDFNGLVLVIGEGVVDIRGANKDITGGMLIAKLERSGDDYQFGVPDVSIRGNSAFVFDSTSLSLAMSMLPMKSIMWREITPDIEPVVASN